MQSENRIQPFILGIGEILTPEEKEIFLQIQPIGFILYSKNLYKSKSDTLSQKETSTKNLIQGLKDLFPNREVQIWIDEEGGALSNLFRAGFEYEKPHLTSYEFYGMFKTEGLEKTEKAVYDQTLEIGMKLKSLGFTGTFAPVADIFYENKSKVIGSRSFGPDVELVIKLCLSSIKAFNDAKIDCCIKHFPGHGLADVDSHHYLPIIKENDAFLMKNDFRVFKELAVFVKYAMTAHIVYECIDKENPITLSKKGIEYVKKNLGFENLKIISDAIDMKALYCAKNLNNVEKESVVQIAKDCLKAGCDIVLYCHPSPEILKCFI